MNIKRYPKYMAIMAICFCVIFIFIFFFKLYPLKYKEIINKYSAEYGIDGALIASVVNVESNFKSNAKSNKGAVGLMQILPSTAKWLCEREGLEYLEDKLYLPDFNINLGVYYLKYLINKFEVVDVAIVAYNAGEGNVLSWLEDSELSADGKNLKKIPFKESKNYLKKVKNSIGIYKFRI